MSPDGSAKPLPEEKLLSLIRGKPARPPAAAGAGASVPGTPARTSAARSFSSLPWTRLAVAGLAAALAVEVILVAVEALRPMPPVRVTEAPAADWAPVAELPRPPSLAESASRELFAPPAATAEPSPEGTSQAPSQTATQLAARLSLLGIVAGDPAQAIIEDAQTKKTHFVSPGQPVTEGAIVEQVSENRVILDLRGEKIELSL